MTTPEEHALADLAEGLKRSVTFVVTDEQMRAFAELSGDFNPLHVDAAFARKKGYDGCVVYGALLIAKVSQLIGMRLPGRDSVWASVSFDFKRPLYVGREAEVEGTLVNVHHATGMVELGLVIRSEGRVLAKGKAEVVLGT
ncbi:MAG: (R)-hydratase [Myxococcales bacterium]|nr:MAG: (R)-hydratase [Myxococcales bacterium]